MRALLERQLRKREESIPWCKVESFVCQIKHHFHTSKEVSSQTYGNWQVRHMCKMLSTCSLCKIHIQPYHHLHLEYCARQRLRLATMLTGIQESRKLEAEYDIPAVVTLHATMSILLVLRSFRLLTTHCLGSMASVTKFPAVFLGNAFAPHLS